LFSNDWRAIHSGTQTEEGGFMKYVVEMVSGAMIYISGFIITG
jgi:hypothetical protein